MAPSSPDLSSDGDPFAAGDVPRSSFATPVDLKHSFAVVELLGGATSLDPAGRDPDDAAEPPPGRPTLASPTRASLSLFYDTRSSAAAIRLRFALNLRGAQSDASDAHTHVHMCLNPEHVSSLTYSRLPSPPENVAEVATKLAGQSTTCIRMTTTSPPSFLVPDTTVGSLLGETDADVRLLQVLQYAATHHLELAIYLPGAALREHQLSALDEATSSSSAGRGLGLKTSARHEADLARMFRGRGRRVSAGEFSQLVASSAPPTASAASSPSSPAPPPPAYHDAAPSPASPPRKRPRVRASSSSPEGPASSDKKAGALSTGSAEPMTVQECGLARVARQLFEAETERQRNWVEERLAKAAEENRRSWEEDIRRSEARMLGELAALRREMRDYIDENMDLRDMDAQHHMEQYVDEALSNAEDSIRESIEERGLRLYFET